MNDNDDLIVIDDIENEAGPSNANGSAESRYATRPKTVAEHNLGSTTTSRLRSGSNASAENPNPERSTRSSTRSKSQPKLKLKLGEKAASQAPGMSFLGPYDRELDSDDEDLAFEEQFILRMPPGEDCEKLRKAIQSREIGNDIWFKFKGMSNIHCILANVRACCRLSACCLSHREQPIFCKACRPTMYRRVPEDIRREANVQGGGYMSGSIISSPPIIVPNTGV